MFSDEYYLVRYLSISFMVYLGVYFALSALGNLTDYHANWLLVHHALAMDNLRQEAGAHWRSIQSPLLQTIAFWLIILTEITIALLALWGGLKLWLSRHKNKEAFSKAKNISLLAVGIGITLYFFGYLTISSEWFRTWLSTGYSPQTPAFQLVTYLCLLFLIIRHTE